MGWPYHFIDLNDAQKLSRRLALDQNARIAQSSVILPLLVLQIYFLHSWFRDRRRRRGEASGGETPSSPRRKSERLGSGTGESWVGRARRGVWWCGERVEVGGVYLGRRGEVVFAGAWLAWLLVLCIRGTGEDYLHLTKRFGIVAASQLPLHYLLALKSPYSPLQLLTRCSHETLNSYHQLLGRIITTLLYLHAGFYLNFYVRKDLLASKVQEAYVLCGIFGIIGFTAIGTTALDPLRRWNYRVFYATHVTLATILLPVLFFHVSHIRVYLYEAVVIYAVNVLLRTLSSRSFTGTARLLPNANLLEINIPITSSDRSYLNRWQPGQHAYVSLAGHPVSRTFRSNPFTVASIPSVDGGLRFVARVLDGNTAALAHNAKSNNETQRITIEGPYGVRTHADRLLQYDGVLLVAGGVGGTFIVPLYRQLLADLSPSKGSYRRQKVTFLWTARSMADVSWAIPEDVKEREGFVDRLKICLTGSSEDISATSNGSFAISDDEDEGKGAYAETDEGIELEERKNLLSDANGHVRGSTGGLSTYAGRPDLARLVDRTFSHGNTERVAVFVCGPGSLSQSLRREVGRWVRRGREVRFWEETFAL